MAHRQQLQVDTAGRGTFDITARVVKIVAAAGVETGLCNIFIHHTSASLLLTENADPQVRRDLETFFSKLVPDGDSMFGHDDEGPDDMPAQVRTVLTESSLTIPIAQGKPTLGTWQGIYVWEHRSAAHQRRVTVTVMG